MARHYHVYIARADREAIYSFLTKKWWVFRTRQAANKFAAKQAPKERRLVRGCDGGPGCPNPHVPDDPGYRTLKRGER